MCDVSDNEARDQKQSTVDESRMQVHLFLRSARTAFTAPRIREAVFSLYLIVLHILRHHVSGITSRRFFIRFPASVVIERYFASSVT